MTHILVLFICLIHPVIKDQIIENFTDYQRSELQITKSKPNNENTLRQFPAIKRDILSTMFKEHKWDILCIKKNSRDCRKYFQKFADRK